MHSDVTQNEPNKQSFGDLALLCRNIISIFISILLESLLRGLSLEGWFFYGEGPKFQSIFIIRSQPA